jgi:hypothetical protein
MSSFGTPQLFQQGRQDEFSASGNRDSYMHRLPACGQRDSNTKPAERVQQLKIQRSLARSAKISRRS